MAERLHEIYWAPGLGLFRDGVLRVPGREPVERPDLAGAFDLIGFSYYSAMGVADGRLAIHPTDAPGLAARLRHLGRRRRARARPPARRGAGHARCSSPSTASAPPTTTSAPPTSREASRSCTTRIERGVDVRGFFHWTGVDNYEWLHGYDVDFGIIDRDRNVRPSARVLQREARP